MLALDMRKALSLRKSDMLSLETKFVLGLEHLASFRNIG